MAHRRGYLNPVAVLIFGLQQRRAAHGFIAPFAAPIRGATDRFAAT